MQVRKKINLHIYRHMIIINMQKIDAVYDLCLVTVSEGFNSLCNQFSGWAGRAVMLASLLPQLNSVDSVQVREFQRSIQTMHQAAFTTRYRSSHLAAVQLAYHTVTVSHDARDGAPVEIQQQFLWELGLFQLTEEPEKSPF